MKREFDICVYCKGPVELQRMRHELRYRGRMYFFDNTPVGVCQQCGERYLTAQDAIRVEEMIHAEATPERFEQVPVLIFDR